MTGYLRLSLALLLALGAAFRVNAQELSFATVSEARKVLSAKDAFVSRMSPFDRAARMKTAREISETEFLAFAASAALEWQPDEIRVVRAAFSKIRPAVMQVSLPLPQSIRVIKTSGLEEGNAAYTREDAIILPKDMIASPEGEIERLLAHELFHIASRRRPKLAEALYETIGFQHCGEVEIPAEFASRKITNPDAPRNDHCINLELGKERIIAIPFLLSRSQKYDVSRGGEFFDYLQLAYLLVELGHGDTSPRVIYSDRGPRVAGLREVSGFFEQVGRNTDYIIHPEEILADNFAVLVLGARNVRSPDVLTRIRGVLEKAGGAEQVVPVEAPKAARH
jgi:hypothetical protein